MKKVLVIVDYQDDFVNPKGKLYVSGAEKIKKEIQERINSKDYEYIIYTFDTHNKKDYENSEESKLFPFIHCEFGTNGWWLYDIKPLNYEEYLNEFKKMSKAKDIQINNEFFIIKDKFNVWEGNKDYENFFTNNFPNDEYIVDICGVAEDICVAFNIIGLLERKYEVNILKNAVKGINNKETIKNIEKIKNLGVIYK